VRPFHNNLTDQSSRVFRKRYARQSEETGVKIMSEQFLGGGIEAGFSRVNR
jgi:hypothetical protein